MSAQIPNPQTITHCYHCGEVCEKKHVVYDDKDFCCQGCQTVYAILADNSMTDYYRWLDKKGNTKIKNQNFDFLELPEVQQKIYQFKDEEIAKVVLYLPSMHCSACVWLLENLYKINPNITYSRVDFQNKELSLTFLHQKTTLLSIVKLLSEVGYTPHFTLENVEKTEKLKNPLKIEERKLIGKIAVAGFCASNIMMNSFPEYFGFDSHSEGSFKLLFQYINLLLTIPVFFYSGFGFIIAAYQNLKKGFLNLDFPLALGIIVLLVRSLYEIFSQTGIGYLDTLAGLIFFLLLGKWFQQRTYNALRYDRDFRSYFPITITKIDEKGNEKITMLSDLKKGDTILVKNNELIPADAILKEEYAHIDYSFVTGESKAIHKSKNELIYAGGQNAGQNIHLEVTKEVAQSYLTSLWNNEIFTKKNNEKYNLQNILAKYFSIGLLLIATTGLLFWGITQSWGMAINVFTAVLIVACPCALTLSAPFALGTAISILGKYGIYLKNTNIIEKIAKINTIVFDKTGTLTQSDKADVNFYPLISLENEEKLLFWALAKNSIHPIAQHIATYLKDDLQAQNFDFQCQLNSNLENFREEKSKGIAGNFGKNLYKIGTASWATYHAQKLENTENEGTISYISIDNKIVGYFVIKPHYREEISFFTQNLPHIHQKYLLSGDNENEKQKLKVYFGEKNMLFNQSPHQKQTFVANLQSNHTTKVMMLGDGLNDAGALQQAEVGLAVTDNIAYFTPASDGIIEGKSLKNLPFLLTFSKKCVQIIKNIFILSLFYNAVILTIALTGNLSPLIVAILMPISSVLFIAMASFWVKLVEE
jgi:Cu+-exporting ATPase